MHDVMTYIRCHGEDVCTFQYVGATAIRVAAVFGPGTGRVWVNRPQCTLNDPSLANCTFGTPLGAPHGCGHANDAGVICYTEFGMLSMHVCGVSTTMMAMYMPVYV